MYRDCVLFALASRQNKVSDAPLCEPTRAKQPDPHSGPRPAGGAGNSFLRLDMDVLLEEKNMEILTPPNPGANEST